MSWQDVNLLQVSTSLEPLPEQTFKFQVLGASKGKFDEDEIQVKAAVADGEFTGRLQYVRYPSPAKFDWSPRVLKRLVQAIGIPLEDSEAHDPVAYFNRVAGDANGAFFMAPMKARNKTDANGNTVPVSEVDIFRTTSADAA